MAGPKKVRPDSSRTNPRLTFSHILAARSAFFLSSSSPPIAATTAPIPVYQPTRRVVARIEDAITPAIISAPRAFWPCFISLPPWIRMLVVLRGSDENIRNIRASGLCRPLSAPMVRSSVLVEFWVSRMASAAREAASAFRSASDTPSLRSLA